MDDDWDVELKAFRQALEKFKADYLGSLSKASLESLAGSTHRHYSLLVAHEESCVQSMRVDVELRFGQWSAGVPTDHVIPVSGRKGPVHG